MCVCVCVWGGGGGEGGREVKCVGGGERLRVSFFDKLAKNPNLGFFLFFFYWGGGRGVVVSEFC